MQSNTFTNSAAPADPGRGFSFALKSFLRELRAYENSPRQFKMSAQDVLITADSFEPAPHGPPGPVPIGPAREKATTVFEGQHGHVRPELERQRNDADAERAAAGHERSELDREMVAAPEWLRPKRPTASSPSGTASPKPEHDGAGGVCGAASPPSFGEEPADAAPPPWGERLFTHFLLALTLGLSVFTWINTANIQVAWTQSWPRALLRMVPVLFAPWLAKFIRDRVSALWPATRPTLEFSIMALGVTSFCLFLFGYYQEVASDSMGGIFHNLALPATAAIGLSITSQVLYECCFGVMLLDKRQAIKRGWCRRNPRRQELQEKRKAASERYNAADARFSQAASSLAALESDRETFSDFVVRFVTLKWQMRQEDFDNHRDRGAAEDEMAGTDHRTPPWLDFVNFLRRQPRDHQPQSDAFSRNRNLKP
jgi:hypothetical protein